MSLNELLVGKKAIMRGDKYTYSGGMNDDGLIGQVGILPYFIQESSLPALGYGTAGTRGMKCGPSVAGPNSYQTLGEIRSPHIPSLPRSETTGTRGTTLGLPIADKYGPKIVYGETDSYLPNITPFGEGIYDKTNSVLPSNRDFYEEEPEGFRGMKVGHRTQSSERTVIGPEKYPNSVDARLARARMYETSGRINEAIQDYQYVLALYPENITAKVALESL